MKENKANLIRLIEANGKYCKVRVDAAGNVTGMLVDENFRYDAQTNTGGRRFIGYFGDSAIMQYYFN